MLNEGVDRHVRMYLGGILVEGYCGNDEAIISWRTIEAEIKRPLPPRKPDEPVYQPMLDRLRAVDGLATDYWRNHARGSFPRYYPRKGA
jgi:hypothetical protein